MKNLTFKDRVNNFEFDYLQTELGEKLPLEVLSFLQKYADSFVKEDTFINNKNKTYKLSSFCTFRMMYDFINDFKKENLGKKFAFAIDPGGWPFCISFDENSFGNILMYQMEIDYKDKNDAFEYVATSFEEFIDGLQPESTQA